MWRAGASCRKVLSGVLRMIQGYVSDVLSRATDVDELPEAVYDGVVVVC